MPKKNERYSPNKKRDIQERGWKSKRAKEKQKDREEDREEKR